MNEEKFTDNTSQTWLLDGRPLVFEQDRPQTIALPQHGIKIVAAGGGYANPAPHDTRCFYRDVGTIHSSSAAFNDKNISFYLKKDK